MSVTRRFRRAAASVAVMAGLAGGFSAFGAHAATGTSSISGVAFQDTNRNGVQDAGEAGFAQHQLYLFDGAGVYVTYRSTDSTGHYTFSGIVDGTYSVELADGSWSGIRNSWAPTTGALQPRRTVQATGAAVVDFAWRPIVRSTTIDAPLTRYVGTNGLTVEGYDDVVSARALYDTISAGSLIGAEAGSITVRFDFGGSNTTTTGASQTNGQYTTYSAVSYVSYQSWLDAGDRTLTHEYGHAWSQYYGYLVQQDPGFSGYLQARGLTGDARIASTYAWNPDEMIAEDFRQLFGSANASSGMQMNVDIPAASQVAGLRDYMATTFRQSTSAGSGSTTTSTTAVSITGTTITPTQVSKSGTVSFTLSTAASVDVEIRDSKGTLVRSVISSAARSAGTSSVTWDRKNAAGQRVKAGSYDAIVRATTSGAQPVTASVTFSVV